MSSMFGRNLRISIFGQSHSEAIGVTIEGLNPGIEIDMEQLKRFMQRRAPGTSTLVSQRTEADEVKFIAGIFNGKTCGAPVTAIIENKDVISKDYENIKDSPRPGHADYVSHIKYDVFEDYRGGGHFSGRLTAPLCVAGGIAKQVLRERGINLSAEVIEVGGQSGDLYSGDFDEVISNVRKEGDSIGGVVKCSIQGIPAGIGEPMFCGVESVISQTVFAIPGVKGISFGLGYDASKMKGSIHNDEFYVDEAGEVRTKTNNHAGILGGITTGEEVYFTVAFKPTSSIAKEQNTVSYTTKQQVKIITQGRHDPCIAVRAAVCVEAACAIAILDLMESK